MKHVSLLCSLVATALAATGVGAQVSPRLIGIYDGRTGDAVAGVEVRDAFSGTYALTSATGTAQLGFLTYRGVAAFVELRKLGYQPKQLVLTKSDTMPITEVLEPVPTLAPMVTTGQYRIDRDAGHWDGFEARCASPGVSCFRTEDLAKKPSDNLADFLIHANGVTLGACGGADAGGRCGKISMKPTSIPPRYCEPTFYVDGYAARARHSSKSDDALLYRVDGPFE